LAWNRGAERMFGYSEKEALKMKIWQLAPPDKAAEQRDFNRRIFAGEKVVSFETQRKTKDGRILDVWLTVTKLTDKKGKVIGIAATERDITERKKAEVLLLARSDIAEALIGTYSLADAAKVILENMSRIEHVDSGSVYIVNQNTKESDLLVQKNLSAQFVKIASHYTKNDRITRLMLTGKPVYLDYSKLRQEKAARDRKSVV